METGAHQRVLSQPMQKDHPPVACGVAPSHCKSWQFQIGHFGIVSVWNCVGSMQSIWARPWENFYLGVDDVLLNCGVGCGDWWRTPAGRGYAQLGFEIQPRTGTSMASLPSDDPVKMPAERRGVPELVHRSNFGGGRWPGLMSWTSSGQ
jgi:hypothetical protein